MFCTNCGKSMPDDVKFCPNCGAVNQHAAAQPAQPEPAPQPQAAYTAPTQPVQPEPAPQPQAAYTAPAQPVQPEPAPQPQAAYTAPAQPVQPEPAPQPQAAYTAPAQPVQPEPAPQPQATYSYTAPAQPAAPVYPQGAYAQPAYAGAAAPAKKKTGLIVGICAGGVVVIAAVVLVILWLTGVFGGGGGVAPGNTPTSVANNYINAIMDSNGVDGQAILDLLPDQLIQEAINEGSYSSEAELAADLESTASSITDDLEYLDSMGVTYSFTVGQSSPVSDSYLETLKAAYEEVSLTVSEAQTVDADFTYTVLGETYTETMEIPVIKIGNTWYLDLYSLS